MIGGLGMFMMIIAALIGVIGGAELDPATTNQIGLFVVGGLLLLIVAIGFWLGLVRPYTNFDDINVPVEPESEEELHADSEPVQTTNLFEDISNAFSNLGSLFKFLN